MHVRLHRVPAWGRFGKRRGAARPWVIKGSTLPSKFSLTFSNLDSPKLNSTNDNNHPTIPSTTNKATAINFNMQRTPDPANYWGSIPGGSRDYSKPVPEVWFGSPGERDKALREELEAEDPCFVFTAAQYYLERIDIDEYFGRLVGHLQADATLHRFDNQIGATIRQVLEVDLVAGAIKSQMLNRAFPRLQAAGRTLPSPNDAPVPVRSPLG